VPTQLSIPSKSLLPRAMHVAVSTSLCAALAACGGGGGGSGGGGQAGATSAAPPPTTSVSGTVSLNGAPLAGATVVAVSTNTNSVVGTVTTGADGSYRFTGLGTACTDNCVQNYAFLAFKPGYAFNATLANGQNRAALEWGGQTYGWNLVNGVSAVRAGFNGAFTNPSGGAPINFSVINFTSVANGSVTGANFTGYDGSNALIKLAATGQATSYAAGDDAALAKGVPIPAVRFIDNGDGTVSDKLTGLVWTKNAGCLSPANWSQALTEANQLASGQCGLSDGSSAGQWRLPNVIELASVIDINRASPAVSGPFTNVSNATYWTSTPYWSGSGAATTNAWAIRLSDGRYINDSSNNLMASSSNDVWAVRGTSGGAGGATGGSASAVALASTGAVEPFGKNDDASLSMGVQLPSSRLIDNGNGTFTDTLTGLVWMKAADCIHATWSGALAAVGQLASGQCGLSDGSTAGQWRMPNRNEMQSLQDRGQNNHALYFNENFVSGYSGVPNQNAIFSDMVGFQYYWTSTTDAASVSEAWTVFTCDYGVYDIDKTQVGYTLAVRDPH